MIRANRSRLSRSIRKIRLRLLNRCLMLCLNMTTTSTARQLRSHSRHERMNQCCLPFHPAFFSFFHYVDTYDAIAALDKVNGFNNMSGYALQASNDLLFLSLMDKRQSLPGWLHSPQNFLFGGSLHLTF